MNWVKLANTVSATSNTSFVNGGVDKDFGAALRGPAQAKGPGGAPPPGGIRPPQAPTFQPGVAKTNDGSGGLDVSAAKPGQAGPAVTPHPNPANLSSSGAPKPSAVASAVGGAAAPGGAMGALGAMAGQPQAPSPQQNTFRSAQGFVGLAGAMPGIAKGLIGAGGLPAAMGAYGLFNPQAGEALKTLSVPGYKAGAAPRLRDRPAVEWWRMF